MSEEEEGAGSLPLIPDPMFTPYVPVERVAIRHDFSGFVNEGDGERKA